MVLIRAEVAGGDAVSIILQNAETVKLVCPAAHEATGAPDSGPPANPFEQALEKEPAQQGGDGASCEQRWYARAVTDIAPGDRVLVTLSDTGRHMGMAVQETLMEV